MRRLSCRSVPTTCRPPSAGHARAEHDVGAAAGHVGGDGDVAQRRPSSCRASASCCWPALATISASRAWFLAFSTSCSMP